MKSTFYFLIAFACLFNSHSIAAEKVSVADGDWFNASNWSPSGVPVSEDTLIINHNIVASDTVNLSANCLIINPNSSLLIDYVMNYSGNLINDGNIGFNELTIGGADETINNGSMDGGFLSAGNLVFENYFDVEIDSIVSGNDSYINYGSIISNHIAWDGVEFENYGQITGAFHMVIGNDLTNHANATIEVDTLTIGEHFENEGDCTGNMITMGTSFTNQVSGNITINELILAPMSTNEGTVSCGNMTSGSGVVNGSTGTFCIQDCWVNAASVSGTIDICDASPMTFCDINMGTIAPSVTFCANTVCSASVLEEGMDVQLTVYPNPAQNSLTVELKNTGQNAFLIVNAIDGKQWINQTLINGQIHTIDISELPSGTYLISVLTDGQLRQEKVSKL